MCFFRANVRKRKQRESGLSSINLCPMVSECVSTITPPELHLHEDQHGRKGRGGKESSEKWVREERKNARESGGEIELVLVQQKLETAASKDINTVHFYCVLRLRATSGHWWFLFLVCVSHVVKAPLFLILVYMLLSWQRGGIRLGKRP